MNERAQVFVDQFGTGGGSGGPGKDPHWQFNEGPVWKLAWQGKIELWKAFWVYFLMGHGLVIGIGCGVMIFSLLAGFAIDPSSTAAGATGLAIGVTVVTCVFLVYAVWSTVGVWQCADNCTVKIRGTYARVLMVGYGTALALPAINYFIS